MCYVCSREEVNAYVTSGHKRKVTIISWDKVLTSSDPKVYPFPIHQKLSLYT